MSILEGIFSLRIVTADFYLENPKPGLDPCFSEFRGKEIRKVPIIRIFGSTAEGIKTCMHVHGTFPYLYIPFDKKDFETLDKAVYLIASSLDKAINISLGQSSSASQHVFKIQLVKGIPFYGYHQNEHQYLKIFMLNPRFVRRAANLLQNGAIMGKTFHPHESHVPYILQFFIDYNLYGMSFLHVPKEVLKFRRRNEEDSIPYDVSKEQILDCSIAAKQSTSKLEVDIGSGFILNRFQLEKNKTSTHANPGIEAIWQDERIRRQNLLKQIETVPPLVLPQSQERPDVKPTISEDFYRVGLQNKLQQLENPVDQSMNDTIACSSFVPEDNTKEKKRTFNLRKLIANAVYPEECSQDDLLTNASYITNHFSSGSIFESSMKFSKSTTTTQDSDDIFLDDTIVDEDLVRCLTQPDTWNQTLREEDMKLLDVMQQLEEEEGENNIDLDSTLAPLSQDIDCNSPERIMQEKSSPNNSREEDDDDNDCLHDFTIIMDDMDELLLKLSQSSFPAVEQCDGADDLLGTPKKNIRIRIPNTPTSLTPKRAIKTSLESPKTPKSAAKKYAPLPLLIQSRSVKKNLSEVTRQVEVDSLKPSIIDVADPLDRKTPISELRKRRMSVSSQLVLNCENSPISNYRSKRRQTVDLDRTHVTCTLRPIRRQSEVRLKFYNAQKENNPSQPHDFGSNRIDSPTLLATNNGEVPCQIMSNMNPKVNIKKFVLPETVNGISEKLVSIEHQKYKTKSLMLSKFENAESSHSDNLNECPSDLKDTIRKSKLSKISPRVELRRCSLIKDNKSSSKNQAVTPRISINSSATSQNPTVGLDDFKEHTEHQQTSLDEQPQTKSKVFVTSKEKKETEETTCACSVSIKTQHKSSPSSNCPENGIIHSSMPKSRQENKSTPKVKYSPRVKLKTCPLLKTLHQNSHSYSSTDPEVTPPNISSDMITKDESIKIKSSSKRKNRLALKPRKQSKANIIDQNAKHSSEDSYKNRTIIVENRPYNECNEERSHFKTKKLRVNLKRYKIKGKNKSPIKIKTSNEHTSRTPFSDRMNIREFRNAVLSTPRVSKEFLLEDPIKDTEDDYMINSFCEHSFIVDSPVFHEIHDFQNVATTDDDGVIIKPNASTQTYEEVESNCKLHGIPDMVHTQPFYSNYLDVTSKKEVGHTVLSIPGRSLNDLESFKSTIPYLESFFDYRKKIVQAMTSQIQNDDRIREYLSTDKITIATPSILPPTKKDAKIWLKARDLLKEKSLDEGEHCLEEDSPIKVRRQKVVMLMETESDGMSNDMDCSMRSLSLTPLTPVTVERNQTPGTNNSLNFTPLTAPKSAGRRESRLRSRNTPKAKISLFKKLRDMRLSNVLEKSSEAAVDETASQIMKCVQTNNLLKTSCKDDLGGSSESLQSETVSNEAALAELEKASFVKNLHNSQGSFDSSFGISNATLNNTFGFKVNLENLKQAKSDVEDNYLTTLSLEIFVSTRDHLLPNPQFDAITCLFYAIKHNISPSESSQDMPKTTGLIIITDASDTSTSTKFNGIDSSVEIKEVANEMEGLAKLLELCSYWDPDIFVGYEIEMSSWGYIMERAKYLDFNIAPLLSRVPTQKVRDFIDEDRDQLTDLDVETKLCGRILLDVWRLMRSEIALTSYSFENVMYHIMHRRCPLHTHKDLSKWFHLPQSRWIVLEYYLERVRGTLELLDQLDLIGRTSEMAKLIGIQFYEVLSRGSQFRVESMMLRIAKPRNLVPLSPSVQQRAHMRAPEYLPLILEPQSRFYPDPMIVLDFQSLYPSMIMAYNYCFSTCLGRVEHLGQSTPFEFGASQLRVSPKLLKQLMKNNMVSISPCGVVFVKKEIREGILPRMLSEILDTRQMVKQSMKLHKNTTALQRILHSRQLGLKLIANVTYGYTAANFSGRMPCVEVGDSVVAKGRETLERAIKLVESHAEWNVKVVYGDTDSLFVLVPGRSKAEAFKIGAEIAELVTEQNPQPVKLKLEKVYQPCILQTKKRYVGYMFETPDQKEPIYEAKGIETVRRDGCPAAVKMLEKTLRILFDSADVSQVKKYVCRQFTKLLSGKANLQDLIFAKEFRGLKGYKPTACVPALELTRKWMQSDPRKIPRRGERVQFIVTNGPPGLPLIKLVRSPHDVLADEGLKINAIYYITKAIIPPLNRCLLLIGADVNEWFADLPRKLLFTPVLTSASEMVPSNASKKNTISQYFSSTNCITDCGRQTKEKICTFCSLDVSNSLVILEEKISKLQRGYFLTQFICQSCCGRLNSINCASLDCPVLYVLEMKRRELNQAIEVQNILDDRF